MTSPQDSRSDIIADIKTALRGQGLNIVHVREEQSRTIVVVGHAGSTLWPHFMNWFRTHSVSLPHGFRARGVSSSSGFRSLLEPLDTWSKEVIGVVANTFGGAAVFPSDRPYLPFQQWLMAATGMRPSPLGILIHPVFGLWHAYRGAIVFDGVTLSQEAEVLIHACDSCAEKPCLSACPVSAFSNDVYDVLSCRTHVKSDAGRECRKNGCLARRACPVGKSFEYVGEQMGFHMEAFV